MFVKDRAVFTFTSRSYVPWSRGACFSAGAFLISFDLKKERGGR